jgi:hypothetical protein
VLGLGVGLRLGWIGGLDTTPCFEVLFLSCTVSDLAGFQLQADVCLALL